MYTTDFIYEPRAEPQTWFARGSARLVADLDSRDTILEMEIFGPQGISSSMKANYLHLLNCASSLKMCYNYKAMTEIG